MVAAWAFLVAVSRGCSLVAVGRLLIAVAPLVEEHTLQGAGARALRLPALEHGPVVVGHRPSCSVICCIFPEQGSNLYPLHLQADSYPLHHQERNPPLPSQYLFLMSFHNFFVLPKEVCQSRCLLSKANKQARLVERKVCFISDASNCGGCGVDICPKADSPHAFVNRK